MLDSLMKAGSSEKADRNENKRPPQGGRLFLPEARRYFFSAIASIKTIVRSINNTPLTNSINAKAST